MRRLTTQNKRRQSGQKPLEGGTNILDMPLEKLSLVQLCTFQIVQPERHVQLKHDL